MAFKYAWFMGKLNFLFSDARSKFCWLFANKKPKVSKLQLKRALTSYRQLKNSDDSKMGMYSFGKNLWMCLLCNPIGISQPFCGPKTRHYFHYFYDDPEVVQHTSSAHICVSIIRSGVQVFHLYPQKKSHVRVVPKFC